MSETPPDGVKGDEQVGRVDRSLSRCWRLRLVVAVLSTVVRSVIRTRRSRDSNGCNLAHASSERHGAFVSCRRTHSSIEVLKAELIRSVVLGLVTSR
jgi:hypothetical protein